MYCVICNGARYPPDLDLVDLAAEREGVRSGEALDRRKGDERVRLVLHHWAPIKIHGELAGPFISLLES
jgi:hypothetical protein